MNRLWKFFALASLSMAAMLAQGDVAQLNGTVTDPHGAAVPNAHIVVLNVDTGQVVEATANDHGEWLLPGMQAATYRVTVSAPGELHEQPARMPAGSLDGQRSGR